LTGEGGVELERAWRVVAEVRTVSAVKRGVLGKRAMYASVPVEAKRFPYQPSHGFWQSVEEFNAARNAAKEYAEELTREGALDGRPVLAIHIVPPGVDDLP
jgi:hypothetical protein